MKLEPRKFRYDIRRFIRPRKGNQLTSKGSKKKRAQMLIILHAGDSLKFIASQGLVSSCINKLDLAARTKNNDRKVHIII